jgi:hypothetical protein
VFATALRRTRLSTSRVGGRAILPVGFITHEAAQSPRGDDVTAGMAAHAVGDDEELRSRIAESWLLPGFFRRAKRPC